MLKNFYRFWMARNMIRLSSLMFSVYFMWEIVEKFHSILDVSLIPTFSLLGYFLVIFPEGYVLDKVNRTLILFFSNFLVLMSYFVLFMIYNLQVIYFVDLLSSIFSLMSSDAFFAYVKDAVEPSLLTNAISKVTMGRAISEIFGGILGGVFAGYFPGYFIYAILTFSLLGTILSIPQYDTRVRSSKYGYKDVIRVIKPVSLFLILLTAFNGLFVSIDALGSGFFYYYLHSTAIYYTIFILGFSLGSLIGGIIASKIGKSLENPTMIVVLLILVSLSFFWITIFQDPMIEPFFTASMGVEVSLADIPLSALLIRVIPNEILGKFNSLTNILTTGASPLMAVVFGTLSTFLKVTNIFIITGFVMLILSILSYSLFKKALLLKEEDVKKTLDN
ncbi:MFS transporter [Metallosphaera tengchongensis]|uniref:MFS transporter n=1 Tax=Metallosphaera tengchongensis TaxID=1532350 RepID=A0A6N0NU20_9CREN|nr:MFS transporter [Metallosphaera tengchongensis]QKR00202.1 MFS transporter [Metallosphaera tengchongensis]